MSEKILSVVIAGYNIEPYIDQCLGSFMDIQGIEKVEVLVVNDGSKDATSAIAKEYAKRYPASIKVVDKENGGHGSVINTGIQMATGKYFKVLDGDDWFEKPALEAFLVELEHAEEDLVLTNCMFVDESSGQKTRRAFSGVPMQKSLDIFQILEKQRISIHVCTFRTDLLKKHAIRVTEKCFYEDNEYILYPLVWVKTAQYVSEDLYMYRVGNVNQSISFQSRRKRIDEHEKILRNLHRFYQTCETTGTDPRYMAYIAGHLAGLISEHYRVYLSFEPMDKTRWNAFRTFVAEVNSMQGIIREYLDRFKVIRFFAGSRNGPSMARVKLFQLLNHGKDLLRK